MLALDSINTNLSTKNMLLISGGIIVAFFLIKHLNEKRLNIISPKSADNLFKNFDASILSSLPSHLAPPYKLAEGEKKPRGTKKPFSINSIGLKPRFDNRY